MQKDQEQMTRREFLDHAARAGAGATAIAAAGSGRVANAAAKKRIALVGTGIRGVTMWGSGVARPYGDFVEFVGLCDINRKRVEVGKQMIGVVGKSELIEMKIGLGGHFGADPKLKDMIFKPDIPDPLKQRAGSRAGAMSLLTGVAAVRSIEQRKPIKINDLVKL